MGRGPAAMAGRRFNGSRQLRGALSAQFGAAPTVAPAAVVVFGAVCVIGVVSTAVAYAGAIRVFFSESVLTAVVLAVVLAIGHWILCRIRPVRPPAAGPAAAAVLWGLTAATGLALIANGALITVWNVLFGLEFGGRWGAAMTAPFTEEALKLTGVVLIALAAPGALRGPVDGFVIGSLVGLGFQVMEDATYALNLIVEQGATAGTISVVQSLSVRVGLTGLGSHWAMSAIAGTAVGLIAARRWRPNARRAWAAAVLVVWAVGLHWLFNAPLLSSIGGAVAKVALVFLSAMAVYVAIRRAYRGRVRRALIVEGEAAGLRRSDAAALVRRHGRRAALARAPWPERPVAAARQRALLDAAEHRADAHGDQSI